MQAARITKRCEIFRNTFLNSRNKRFHFLGNFLCFFEKSPQITKHFLAYELRVKAASFRTFSRQQAL